MFYLIMHSTHFWHWTGPLREQERKPAAATTWANLSD